MTAIDNPQNATSSATEAPVTDAWELLRDLISPRPQLHLPEDE